MKVILSEEDVHGHSLIPFHRQGLVQDTESPIVYEASVEDPYNPASNVHLYINGFGVRLISIINEHAIHHRVRAAIAEKDPTVQVVADSHASLLLRNGQVAESQDLVNTKVHEVLKPIQPLPIHMTSSPGSSQHSTK